MRGRDVILALAFALTASGCGAPRDSAKQLVKEAGRIGARSWPQAVQLYAGALQKNPHLAGAYLGLSIAEERSGPGYYSLAAHAAREGIALAPKDYRLYQQLADVEYNQDKYEQATADEMKSVALVPRAADAYSGIADKLTDLKQWDAAIVVVGRMIALDPNSAEYYIRRGTLYTSEGAYSRAHGDFAQALRLSHSKATSALGYSQDALASLK
jgi:tetratricopeptide (TPR) repeat protein